MSATNLPPPRKNGSARAHAGAKAAAAPANGKAPKRSPKPSSADGSTVEATAGPPELAGFAPASIRQMDAEMWPIQPVIWLHPEWQPGLPASSGLRIERHHKVPAPSFLNLEAGRGYGLICSAGGLAAGLSSAPSALLPKVPLTPPESGLTLLGWDPRTVVPLVKTPVGSDLVAPAVLPPVRSPAARPPALPDDRFHTDPCPPGGPGTLVNDLVKESPNQAGQALPEGKE